MIYAVIDTNVLVAAAKTHKRTQGTFGVNAANQISVGTSASLCIGRK